MKIKLINPARKPEWKESFMDFRTIRKLCRRKSAGPPLALPTLAAATPEGTEIVLSDENVGPVDFDESVDLVGITGMTSVIPRAYEIADEFRRRSVPVVLGGMHASFFPEEAAKFCDAVVIGEADEIWSQVVRDAERKQLQKVYRVERRPDISRLPPPRWDLLKAREYCLFPIQTTRGCPHHCEFCAVVAFSGSQYRRKRIEQVIAEIAGLQQIAPEEFIMFSDDNLLAAPAYASALLRELAPLRLQPWHCLSSINNLQDDSLLDLLRQAGCQSVFVGLESLSDETLASMRKQRTNVISAYKETIRRVHDHGIAVFGSFILTPDDDAASLGQLAGFIEETDMAFAMINILTPVPGSRLFEQAFPDRNIALADWKLFDGENVCFGGAKEIERLRGNLLADLYDYDKMLGRLARNWRQNILTRRPLPRKRALENRGLLSLLSSALSFDIRRLAFLLKCFFRRERPDLASVALALSFHDYAKSLNVRCR